MDARKLRTNDVIVHNGKTYTVVNRYPITREVVELTVLDRNGSLRKLRMLSFEQVIKK